MATSQCLEDSPGWRVTETQQDLNLKDLYNERHRLGLETLVSEGVNCFMDFLKKERLPNFLSDKEIRSIIRAAVVPKNVSLAVEDSHLDQSSTLDCSSVTYFPEVSDVEPPVLEIGWPAFRTGSFRGVTRAVAHFQPSYGDTIYSCKEAVRRMIKNAKEVIAIVTDSLTDQDIFHDLLEACTRCRVPVYILLDQCSLPAFLQMCRNLDVGLDEFQLMRVRTITGSTYYMRSGARLTGKVHKRFMLVDGNKVATGSYRFNWTDGKLNSSNLIELSGQITENFDEEFRILYAQSLPINTRLPSIVRNAGIYDHLVLKTPGTPNSQLARAAIPEQMCLTSTPNRAVTRDFQKPGKEREDEGKRSSPGSDTSTLGENWMERDLGEVLMAADEPAAQAEKVKNLASTQTVTLISHTSTQTSFLLPDTTVQTETPTTFLNPCPASPSPTSSDQANVHSDSSTSSSSPPIDCPAPVHVDHHPSFHHRTVPTISNLRECFCKLTKERQYHYSTIRSKLDHMMLLLSHRKEQIDLAALAFGPSLHRGHKAAQAEARQLHGANNGVYMGTWPRSRCLQ